MEQRPVRARPAPLPQVRRLFRDLVQVVPVLRDAPADGAAVGPVEGVRADMTFPSGRIRPRACCPRPRIVVDGHEAVCASCGTVGEERLPDDGSGREERAESGLLAARVRVGDEAAVGTRDVSPPSVLRSKRYRRIFEGARDPFDATLQRACGMLSLPPACCRRAAHVARAVRARCAGGAPPRRACVAYFAIYRTCSEYGIGASEDEMAGAVRAAFAVKRAFRPRRAVFAVGALLAESGGEGECVGSGGDADAEEGADAAGGEGGGGGPACGPPTAAEAAASRLRRIGSEPLRRSALRLSDSGAPLAVAVEIARRMELIAPAASAQAAAPA